MERVRVHWNLHRGGYSITVRGIVVEQPAAVTLRDVHFVVSAKGLARMRRLGRRKVVAWATGMVVPEPERFPVDAPTVTFNPWRGDTFTVRETGEPITGARCVAFLSGEKDGAAVPVAIVVER